MERSSGFEDRHDLMRARVFDQNYTKVSDPSPAGSPVRGAIAAARTVPRDLIRVIARVGGVIVPALRVIGVIVPALRVVGMIVPASHFVIATPEIREATYTTNLQDIGVLGRSSESQNLMDDTSLNRYGR
jgi:hypothetical protein